MPRSHVPCLCISSRVPAPPFLGVTLHCLGLVSQLQYQERCHRATPVSSTPEMERVRRNQEQLSAASCFCFLLYFIKQCMFSFFTMPLEKLQTLFISDADVQQSHGEGHELGPSQGSPGTLFIHDILSKQHAGTVLVSGTHRWARPTPVLVGLII